MNPPPARTAPAPPLDRGALRAALESAGWRCTPQREAIYDHLGRVGHHPTAEEVYRSVRRDLPRISLATVYKALEALVVSGVAARLAPEGSLGSARYDVRGDDHYHLRCLRSGVVEDLPTLYDPALIDKVDPGLARSLRGRGFVVTGYRLELVGYFDEGEPGAGSP